MLKKKIKSWGLRKYSKHKPGNSGDQSSKSNSKKRRQNSSRRHWNRIDEPFASTNTLHNMLWAVRADLSAQIASSACKTNDGACSGACKLKFHLIPNIYSMDYQTADEGHWMTLGNQFNKLWIFIKNAGPEIIPLISRYCMQWLYTIHGQAILLLLDFSWKVSEDILGKNNPIASFFRHLRKLAECNDENLVHALMEICQQYATAFRVKTEKCQVASYLLVNNHIVRGCKSLEWVSLQSELDAVPRNNYLHSTCNLVYALGQQRRYLEAEEIAMNRYRLSTRPVDKFDALLGLIHILLGAGQMSEAGRWFEEAIDLIPLMGSNPEAVQVCLHSYFDMFPSDSQLNAAQRWAISQLKAWSTRIGGGEAINGKLKAFNRAYC
jgi:tetratricopeptide (TPR) repeat protein